MENLFNLYLEYVFGVSLQTLEDVFHWISQNGSLMPAHRALPVSLSLFSSIIIYIVIGYSNYQLSLYISMLKTFVSNVLFYLIFFNDD